MCFPANLELVYTLLNFGFQQQEYSWAYDNIQYVQRNFVLEHCKKLYTSFCKTNKQKRKLLFFVTTAENSAVFAQEVESIYLFGNYLLTSYTRLYTLLFGHVTCITL